MAAELKAGNLINLTGHRNLSGPSFAIFKRVDGWSHRMAGNWRAVRSSTPLLQPVFPLPRHPHTPRAGQTGANITTGKLHTMAPRLRGHLLAVCLLATGSGVGASLRGLSGISSDGWRTGRASFYGKRS